MRLSDLSGNTVGIWGFGIEGRAALRAALDQGARDLVVVDRDPQEIDLDTLVTPRVDELHRCDIVVRSPGISRYREDALHVAANTTVTTGTSLALAELAAADRTTVCVSGTKGKSTTSALLTEILHHCGYDPLHAGNIGVPLLDVCLNSARDFGPSGPVIAELSSQQAADVEESHGLGILTSLAPEHLDWHGTIERYYRDKLHLFTAANDIPILSSRQAMPIALQYLGESHHLLLPENLVPNPLFENLLSGYRLRGEHNASNLRLAVASCTMLGIDVQEHWDSIRSAIREFRGLPHRMAQIASHGGLTFIDDTLSTTPLSVIAALDSITDHPITLIVGGFDRGLDFTELGQKIARLGPQVTTIAMPDTGRKIISAASSQARLLGTKVRAFEVDNLNEAISAAIGVSPSGTAVLLSPGSPSFNRYANYLQLASHFNELVHEHGLPPTASPRTNGRRR